MKTDTEKNSNDDINRADLLLRGFVGRRLVLIEKSEYQLRLIFGPGTEFIVSSPWRLCRNNEPLVGSGDFRGAEANVQMADLLIGAKVLSTVVSQGWETKLSLEGGYVMDVFPDSVQYEIWEAHSEAGWIVFSGGRTTLFPPTSPSSVAASQTHSDAPPDGR